MATKLNPYINFKDNAREALEFYTSVFGGKLTTSTFQEAGMVQDPSDANKIMHGMLVTDNDMTLMAADTPAHMQSGPIQGMSISLSGDDEAELTRYYEQLSDGGQITVPLAKAPWGDTFGMCSDKFGVDWLVNINGAAQASTTTAA